MSAAPGGLAAIAALEAAGKLGLVAARADTAAEGLQQLLLQDKDLKLQPHTNRLFYSCGFGGAGHRHSHSDSVTAAASVSARAIGDQTGPADPAVANWNKLHSRPGSTKTFYLDVSGCQVPASQWDANPISRTPFSLDNDTSTLSDAEKAAIVQIWRAVAADFSELDVDVTTEPTAMSKIFRTSADDDEHGVRVCIGGTVMNMTAGGVAFLNSFSFWDSTWSEATDWGYQPAWIFATQSSGPQDLALATSHELGHTLGLSHDGCTTQAAGDQEYFKGAADLQWGPIMGAPYGARLATFDRGEYPCYVNEKGAQVDFDVMTRPQFLTYIDDSVGSTTATALDLCPATAASSCGPVDATTTRARADAVVSVAKAGGVDKNVFKLQAGAGQIRAAVSVVPPVQIICPCAGGGTCDAGACLCAANDGMCYSPAPAESWYRSNLLLQIEILSAAGAVVAGPVSNS